MRLRRTAFPTMRAAIANPRRGTGAPVLRANIAKKASAERRASRYTRSNSDFCRRRCAGLNCRAGDEATKAVSALTVQIAGLVGTLHAGSRRINWLRKFAPKQAHGGRK